MTYLSPSHIAASAIPWPELARRENERFRAKWADPDEKPRHVFTPEERAKGRRANKSHAIQAERHRAARAALCALLPPEGVTVRQAAVIWGCNITAAGERLSRMWRDKWLHRQNRLHGDLWTPIAGAIP